MIYWKKLSQEERKNRIERALDENVNFSKDASLGYPASKLDGKVKNTLGRKLRDYQLSRFGVASQPFYVLVDQNENVLVKPVGECSKEEFLKFLNDGIAKFEATKSL